MLPLPLAGEGWGEGDRAPPAVAGFMAEPERAFWHPAEGAVSRPYRWQLRLGCPGNSRLPMKPPPDRLYGRQRGHTLRARQRRLLAETLPRMQFALKHAADPLAAFSPSACRGTLDELWLEIGFGGGEHAQAMAAANPHAGLIACEVFQSGLCSLLSRLVPDSREADAPLPPNLLIWPDDGRILLRALPAASLSRLFLMFPDPWPKARHAKRRFVHPELIPSVARALRSGGEWRIASDDPSYQDWVDTVLDRHPDLPLADSTCVRPAGWPPTRYEKKALQAGRTPKYWRFQRR